MKEKKKQNIINIITIINIIIIITISIHFILNNKYSRKYIMDISKNNSNRTNYIAKIEELIDPSYPISIYTITSKEDIYKIEHITDNYISWNIKDFLIREDTKYKIPMKYTPMTLRDIFDLYSYYDDTSYEYKYIGKEMYNNVNCIVVQFERESTSTIINSEKVKFWIDEDKEIVLRKDIYNDSGELIRQKKFEILLDVVSNKDLILPDISDFINPNER